MLEIQKAKAGIVGGELPADEVEAEAEEPEAVEAAPSKGKKK